jgi:hypothetical protein
LELDCPLALIFLNAEFSAFKVRLISAFLLALHERSKIGCITGKSAFLRDGSMLRIHPLNAFFNPCAGYLDQLYWGWILIPAPATP